MPTATILALFVGYHDPDRRLARRPVPEIELVAGRGIRHDKSFGRSAHRQVNIIEARFYDWFAASFARRLPYGSAGENVVIDSGVDTNWLAVNAPLTLGRAGLRLADFRTPCKTLATALTGDLARPSLFVGRVGILCAVTADGSASVGQSLCLVSAPDEPIGLPRVGRDVVVRGVAAHTRPGLCSCARGHHRL